MAEGFIALLARCRGPVPDLLLDRGPLVSEHATTGTSRRRERRRAPGCRCRSPPSSDPHLGDAARNPSPAEAIDRPDLRSSASSMIAGFGVAYWQNWNPWIIGVTMGVGLFLLGFGLTAWGKYLMPQGPFVEERHRAGLVARGADGDVGRPGGAVGRGGQAPQAPGRPLRARVGDLRHRGHLPAAALARARCRARPSTATNWRKGSLLVDSNGRPVHRTPWWWAAS